MDRAGNPNTDDLFRMMEGILKVFRYLDTEPKLTESTHNVLKEVIEELDEVVKAKYHATHCVKCGSPEIRLERSNGAIGMLSLICKCLKCGHIDTRYDWRDKREQTEAE